MNQAGHVLDPLTLLAGAAQGARSADIPVLRRRQLLQVAQNQAGQGAPQVSDEARNELQERPLTGWEGLAETMLLVHRERSEWGTS